MFSARTRVVLLLVSIVGFYFGVALLYQAGMVLLEGKPRTFLDSFQWAAETITTTGYGIDARWSDPLMIAFVAAVQFCGMFLGPLILALVLLPFLAERFEARVPRQASGKLAGHVVVYGYAPTVETLLQRLHAAKVPALVVETDEARARAVMERGQDVVFSRVEEDALDICRIGTARSLVANAGDQENAALVLRARQMGFRGDIYAFVEDPAHRKPMDLAGATGVYTPRHIVAAALAAHASDRLSPRLPGLKEIGGGLERRELRIRPDSPLAGKTLGEARIPAAIVGIWSRSHLITRCTPDLRIEPGVVLELVGTAEALERSAAMAAARLLGGAGPFLIAGFGEVGRKVHELLIDVREEVRVVERRAGPLIDVSGDVLDSAVLERAGLGTARALVLALDSDDSTLFATVIARDANPEIPIIARVNHSRNVDSIHRAGADYALSIADVTGQVLSARILGLKVRVREEHHRIVRMEGWKLGGRTPLDVARNDGRAVLALVRAGTLISTLGPEFPIERDDAVWLCAV